MQSVKANHDAIHPGQNTQPFTNLKGEARARLDGLGMDATYMRGSRLFVEGERSKCVFFLTNGRIKLVVNSREGKSMILRIAEAGQVLGLSAALSGSEHEVTAEPIEPCQVRAIPTPEFVAFLEDYPEAAREATRSVLRDYQMVFNDVCRLALPSTVAGRVANLLLEWRKSGLEKGHSQTRFTMALTHEEIAGMAATSRETVTRVFSQFEREKLISIKGSSLTVLQPEALQQLAM